MSTKHEQCGGEKTAEKLSVNDKLSRPEFHILLVYVLRIR